VEVKSAVKQGAEKKKAGAVFLFHFLFFPSGPFFCRGFSPLRKSASRSSAQKAPFIYMCVRIVRVHQLSGLVDADQTAKETKKQTKQKEKG
jgi:hypothetical protein